jgi:hypothetical protein
MRTLEIWDGLPDFLSSIIHLLYNSMCLTYADT